MEQKAREQGNVNVEQKAREQDNINVEQKACKNKLNQCETSTDWINGKSVVHQI